MVKIIDTYSQINSLFENEAFSLNKWEIYINSIFDNSAHIFKDDIKEYLDSGTYTYEKDFFPIINAVYKNPSFECLHNSFTKVTENLNARIIKCFGNELEVDIVLYLGLCNAAGWVTNINGKDTVLLGVEKIIELNWQGIESMYGLIYHELGHVYQKQHGILDQYCDDKKQYFVWKLFTEGIAMYFEQLLVHDLNFYHQDGKGGWKEWCDNHFQQIVMDFNHDLPTMDKLNQRYFGDWVNYHDHGDVGYYLGTKFVHYLIKKYNFTLLINLKLEDIYKLYLAFVQEQQGIIHKENLTLL
ncbi:hypothetical protein R2R35_06720 [Anaerocolumna sp. AGMB13020]|uniref:hypothetical protein n=1 Tax=Anaerocolumna sp. AGMB13020 TaxID=3081750 RepID=UPI002952FCDE|nr:hypothetical protein [Anaerocolumna sp. AGMB13020]WOO38190.1 hypothetical protein R2R35_06720 [Anaerocolumna sp. AGMB13020]